MLNYLVEYLGTFLFLSVVVAVGQPIPIALALLVVILLGGSISGGHFNPAISLMFWAKGALTNNDLAGYVVAQCLGGISALAIYNVLSNGRGF
jgi:glycerol uptake facilitator-like aquaporin